MSRIRSQLDSILADGENGGSNLPSGRPPARPRPAYPHPADSRSDRVHEASRREPSFRQPARNDGTDPLESIQSSLEKLSARINAIPRKNNDFHQARHDAGGHAPAHVRPYSPSQAAPGPDPEFIRGMQQEMLRELRSGFESIRGDLRDVREASQSDNLDGEMRRISEGIAALQDSRSLHPDYVDQIRSELATLQSGLEHLLQKPEAHFDLSGVSRSIESGYSEIVNKLDAYLAQRPEGASDLPDYSSHFDSLTRRIEEVSRAVVSLSVSMPTSSSAPEFERIEARIADLTKAVDAMLSGQVGAAGFHAGDQDTGGMGVAAGMDRIGERIDLLADKIDSMSALDRAGGEVFAHADGLGADLSGLRSEIAAISAQLESLSIPGEAAHGEAGHAIGNRLDGIQNEIGIVARMLETLSAGGIASGEGGGFPGFDLSGIENRLVELANRIDAIAHAPDANSNQLGQEAVDILRELVNKVDALSAADAVPADDRFRSLEDQLSSIAGQLGTLGTSTPDLSAFAERLDNIEGQIAASRDIVIDIASEAAQRGSAGQGEDGPAGSELAIHAVLEELKALREERAQSTHREEAGQAGEMARIADSISQIAARLDTLEQSEPSHAAYSAMEHAGDMPSQMGQGTYSPVLNTDHGNPAGQADQWHEEPVSSPLDADFGPQENERQAAGWHHEEYSSFEAADTPPMDGYAPIDEGSQAAIGEHGEFGYPQSGEPLDAMPYAETKAGIEPAAEAAEAAEADDVPMAPGSGMPDLEALVRRATNKKKQAGAGTDGGETGSQNESLSELMAAARRAAQAAAVEAETAREKESGRKARKSRIPGKGKKFSLNRKSLLAATAIAALLVGGMTIVPRFLGGSAPVVESGDRSGQMSAPAGDVDAGSSSGQQIADANGEGSTSALAPGGEVLVENGDAGDQMALADDESNEPADGRVDSRQPDADMQMSALDQDAATDGGDEPRQAAVQAGDEPVLTGAGADLPASIANQALRQAVAAGDPNALFEVARRYTDGDGVERDLGDAVRWYEMAANRGHAPSQYRLGNFHEKGHGVAQDLASAAMWYEKAAMAGNALAMHNLGVLNAQGLVSGDADMSTAIGWFEKAADLGVKDSQVNLGILYTKGMGVEEDLVTAYRWFAIAARGGDADAAKKRDTVAQAMRPEQLEKARGEAEVWKPREIDQAANAAMISEDWGNATSTARISADAVRKVQQLLTRAGFDAGPADGVMGQRTRDAISRFQQDRGIAVTGSITPELVQALEKVAI